MPSPQTQADLSSTRDAVLSAKAIQRLIENASIWFKCVERDPLPEGQGTLTIRFRKLNSMTVASVPVPTTEGVTVSPSSISFSYVTATIEQFSRVVDFTDLAERAYEKGKLADEIAEIVTEASGKELAQLMVNLYNSGTNRYFAGNVADTVNVASAPDFEDTLRIDRTMRENNVVRNIPMVDASTGIGTLPVGEAFLAICSTAATYDLQAMAEFIRPEGYGNVKDLLHRDELGAVNGARYVPSSMGPVALAAGAAVGATGLRSAGGANVDVYSTFYFGSGAIRLTSYGNVGLDVMEDMVGKGESKTLKRKMRGLRLNYLNDADKSDPNNQRRLCGAIYEVAKAIVQPLALLEFEHGVTA